MQVLSGERGERGDIVLGWLTKVVVVLGLLGLVGFDLISVGVGHLQTQDRAAGAARAAETRYRDGRDVQQAYEAALARLAESNPAATIDPASFSVSDEGSVTLTVEHTSTTFLVEKVPPARDWAVARATVTVHPVR